MKPWIKIVSIVLLILVSAGGAGASYYWYTKYQKIVANPTSGSAEEVKILVKKLSAFMELPAETPSVVTITDRAKLQNQEFFKKAQNGDKIIVYQQAKRIFLYRPSTKRIIDVAPLVFNDQNQTAPDVASQILLPTPTESTITENEATSAANPTPIENFE